MDLSTLASDALARVLGQDTRPYRLRFAGERGSVFQDTLVPQRLDITEGVCEGVTAHVTCLATRADLPLKELLGLPVEVQIVTDTGDLRRICVVATDVRQGQSDGSVTAIQFTGRDIFAAMEGRRTNRVFLNRSATDILRIVLDGWRKRFPALACAFDYEFLRLGTDAYPTRAFTFQAHQSDAAFLRSLCRRNGISWFFRASPDGDKAPPMQQLVFFDDGYLLPENSAGPIKYHRRSATEKRDTISLLASTYTLINGSISRASDDHESGRVAVSGDATIADQGRAGNAFAAALQDARIILPHAGDTPEDEGRLTRLDILRHEFNAQGLHGVGGVRAQAVCEYNRIDGHPMLDTEPPAGREYITVRLKHWAENSLPKQLNERAQALLAASEQEVPGWATASNQPDQGTGVKGEHRYTNRFLAVPRRTPIVPAWDPQVDLPTMPLMTATVVGPEGQPVYCDELGRVKLRFHGLDPVEHEHAGGAGTNGNEGDSAWVRVNFLWAGQGFGIVFPLRAGMEVSVGFEMGDPSRPMIIGSRYSGANLPPRFDHLSGLPANRTLSGIVTRELNGGRQQQLRFDDTNGRIGTQLGSDHASAQLNLGYLSTPMNEGETRPRGEGVELRTTAAFVARGEQGVHITAAPLPGDGPALERAPLIGLAEALQGIQRQLSQLAATHQSGAVDGTGIEAYIQRLRDWENGSNTSPGRFGGGAPMAVVSATSSVALGSGDNLLLGAQTNIDAVSVGNTQIAAGQKVLICSNRSMSVFAQEEGINIVAGKNELRIAANDGNVSIAASKWLLLSAGEGIRLEAPAISQLAQGVQIDSADGQITQQSSGAHIVKSSSFAQIGPGGSALPGLTLPKTTGQYNQHVVLTDFQTGEPLPGQPYRITVEDGCVFEGTSDAQGKTQVFETTIPFARYTIELLDLPESR